MCRLHPNTSGMPEEVQTVPKQEGAHPAEASAFQRADCALGLLHPFLPHPDKRGGRASQGPRPAVAAAALGRYLGYVVFHLVQVSVLEGPHKLLVGHSGCRPDRRHGEAGGAVSAHARRRRPGVGWGGGRGVAGPHRKGARWAGAELPLVEWKAPQGLYLKPGERKRRGRGYYLNQIRERGWGGEADGRTSQRTTSASAFPSLTLHGHLKNEASRLECACAADLAFWFVPPLLCLLFFFSPKRELCRFAHAQAVASRLSWKPGASRPSLGLKELRLRTWVGSVRRALVGEAQFKGSKGDYLIEKDQWQFWCQTSRCVAYLYEQPSEMTAEGGISGRGEAKWSPNKRAFSGSCLSHKLCWF